MHASYNIFCSMYIGRLPLRDHDYLRLQFLGAKNGWLGCDQPVCDLRTCPSYNHNYRYFDSRCSGEKFQIISDGNQGSSVTSGQRIRLRYLHKHNSWMGCSHKNRCEKNTCPGTTSQGTNFRNNRCSGEIFKIYARGRDYGQTIYNGDVVMLYYAQGQRYVSIQGEDLGHDTRLNFCPGIAPPAYLSYGICSENVFRIYRKP